MMGKYLILALLLISNVKINCVDLEAQTYQALNSYFQELLNQDSHMEETIRANFGVSDQATVDFLMQQIDPVNLAIDIFKQYFTIEETQVILAFHTSEIGRKFGNIFPSVMASYADVLNQKMQEVQLALASVITNHTMIKD
mgnify:CR=1 FL=1